MKKILFSALTLLLTTAVHAADNLVTLPQGVEPEDYTLTIIHAVMQQNGIEENTKKMTAMVAFDGNDVYVQGLAYYFPEAYVKGTLEGDKITFASGQFVGEDAYGPEYLTGYTLDADKNVHITDFVLYYDADTRNLSYDPSIYASETSAPNDIDAALYAYVKDALYTPGGLPPLVAVEVPEGLQTEPYLLVGTRSLTEENEEGEMELIVEPYEIPVQIGFDGNDLYIQGMVENVSYAWAKATKNAQGRYVIPVGQYIGTSKLYNQEWNYFLSSVNRMGALTAISFVYNATTQTFTCSQTIALTVSKEKADSYYTLNGVTIKKIEEREATPSAPQITFKKQNSPYGSAVWYFAEIFVPLTDTESRPMLSDKLTYVFLRDKGDDDIAPVTFPMSKYYMLNEDLTEIPYSFTDGLDISRHTVYFEKLGVDELKTWKRLGLQTIYRGNGLEHRSDITWLDLDTFWNPSSISDIMATGSTAAYYDLQGRQVTGNAKGLVIQQVQLPDGTVRAVKTFKR